MHRTKQSKEELYGKYEQFSFLPWIPTIAQTHLPLDPILPHWPLISVKIRLKSTVEFLESLSHC